MPEVARPMIQVNYVCDTCTMGLMYPTGNIFFKGIEHQCSSCGDIQYLEGCYPKLGERNGS